MKQSVDLSAFQQRTRVHLVNDAVRHSLLTDLSVVDLLLHRVVWDESVDVARARLTVAVDTTDSLTVMAWVPRSIKHHHTTSTHQVDAETAGTVHTSNTINSDTFIQQILIMKDKSQQTQTQ